MKRSAATKYYASVERRIIGNNLPSLDLRTLEVVHNFMEFEAEDDMQLDAWLHAQIVKARRCQPRKK